MGREACPGNYLRVRGEYRLSDPENTVLVELPPRARRIPNSVWKASLMLGTTSACAENTIQLIHPTIRLWNYLRVRGEYTTGRMS